MALQLTKLPMNNRIDTELWGSYCNSTTAGRSLGRRTVLRLVTCFLIVDHCVIQAGSSIARSQHSVSSVPVDMLKTTPPHYCVVFLLTPASIVSRALGRSEPIMTIPCRPPADKVNPVVQSWKKCAQKDMQRGLSNSFFSHRYLQEPTGRRRVFKPVDCPHDF